MFSINDLANNFKRAAERCDEQKVSNSGNIEWLPIPYIVNATLACELYLKAILDAKKVDRSKTHNLNDLFSLLPKEIQVDVENRCANVDFYANLMQASKMFIEWRYLHEMVAKNVNITANLEFIRNLINSLCLVAETE